ncbi:Mediator of RNA polymerase II transcription subunit 13 [Morella rubra]|uniref:Mediator of RNA polymerase II transcription subunit 13 n=1 Tax=Morella rubra TaxID=262757 RepID=A0A6A1WRV1_9ROSI|nr:Mediator of RNA polymerase II transcription subunit 13 [Morella rubra]
MNSVKAEQKDTATLLVLSSHLQLQKEGFLSTWTNSFVGPWDPSQGLHNPGRRCHSNYSAVYCHQCEDLTTGCHTTFTDEKIKLWLFLPGRHSSVVEAAQIAVSRLRVIASGIWLAPGDSEEVAAALSQALRNCIERSLTGLSYMRFGDVFSKYTPSQSEDIFRRGQPTVEFIFAATEEAVFVHVIISAKHIRALSVGDIERVLKRPSNNSGYRLPVLEGDKLSCTLAGRFDMYSFCGACMLIPSTKDRYAVIVSPHGIRGRLTGCCPGDLVKQVYFSSGKFKMSNGFIGLPYHVSQGSGCQMRGQSCYVEVTLGCPRLGRGNALQSNTDTTGIFQRIMLLNLLLWEEVIRRDQQEMQALQLSKSTTLISRALFLAASTTSSSCRRISTIPHFPLSSPSCLTDINHRSDTWPSSPATNLLLRTPWSATQYRGVKAYGSDVLKTDHSHEGRGKATIKVELRDIESGNKVSQRLGTDESVERVFVHEKTYMYMCTDRSGTVVLMDVETFDQLEVSQELFGKDAKYLQGDMRVTVRLYDGTPFSASVPKRVTCIVKEAQESMAGIPPPPKDRKVVLDNGLILEVPTFVVAGDAVVINTETDTYIERAKG